MRPTRRRPASSVSAANSAMYWLTPASSAAASIRRAPSRTISSVREPDSVEPSAFTTLSTGVSSRPALRTRADSVTIKGSFGKVRPSRAVPKADPQVLSIARRRGGQGPSREAQAVLLIRLGVQVSSSVTTDDAVVSAMGTSVSLRRLCGLILNIKRQDRFVELHTHSADTQEVATKDSLSRRAWWRPPRTRRTAYLSGVRA